MKYTSYSKLKLFILLSLTSLFVFSIIRFSTSIGYNDRNPQVKEGVIDLRNWDFKKDGIVKLKGEWEFYENQLLEPTDFNDKVFDNKKYLNIPGSFGKNAYGTYRLKILVNDINDIYSVKIDFLQSAYKLWANNRLAMSVGEVGIDKNSMTPQLLPKIAPTKSNNGEVYLTLQVSNFYAKFAYIDNITFGENGMVNNYSRVNLAFNIFLFGSTLMAAIYNLGLFFKRKKDKSTLYFAIVCLIVSIRTLFLGERFIISIFPDFSYIISGKIMHWTFYLYVPFIVLFVDSFYENVVSKAVLKLSKTSAYTYAILVLICPWKYYPDLILPFELLTIYLLSYLIIKLSKVYFTNKVNDYTTVLGLFALLLTRINDILYEYSIIITGTFAPLGILLFIIGNSYLLAKRQSIALSSVEIMSEQLKSLDKLKDDFLAITSHELQTPLNGIIGLSESLSNSPTLLNKNDKEDLEIINVSAKRLSNLVNDIMVFSKLKNNVIVLHKKPVNINKAVDLVVKFLKLSTNNRKVEILNLLDNEVPYIYGDEGRIHQILYNIIGNAVKFTTLGDVKIYYNLEDNFLEVCIQDSGIGIPEDRINKIFNLYEQVEGTSEKYGGTGLGLYISKQLIELHGGSINVISEVNKGSTFKVSLPICSEQQLKDIINTCEFDEKFKCSDLNPESDFQENLDTSKNTNKSLNTYKILVVDDEYVNQKVLEGYIKNEKYLIVKAYSGKEALRIIDEQKDFDLVIVDMMMPDLTGYEVCNIIREKYSLFELPILMMTADNRLENLVVSFECGANDYLIKPYNKHELNARVNTLLNLKYSVQEALKLVQEVALANKQVESLNQKNIESSKKVEELLEYDNIRTEFFTNMSHELRTPLNIICSTIQLMGSLEESKTLGDERIKYYMSIMNQNSLRLLRLINNLIDMTKVDSGYLNLNLSNGDIVYVVEELTQSVAEYVRSKNITITFDTEVEEKIIAFDEEKIERIILNILSNAVKFTNEGGSIDVNMYEREGFVEISIKDTGIGIPEDKLNYIFERFAQVDKSMARRSEGSGIGLSLVKSLVKMHGGTIRAKSKIDKGTEFIIKLPDKTINSEDGLNKQVPDSKYEKSLNVEFSDIYI